MKNSKVVKLLVVYYIIILLAGICFLGFHILANFTDKKLILIETISIWFILIPLFMIGTKYILNRLLLKNNKELVNYTNKVVLLVDVTILLIIRIILKLI